MADDKLPLNELDDASFLQQPIESELPEAKSESDSSLTSESESGGAEEKSETSNDEPEDSDELPEDFDYKSEYTKLFAPFKADGKFITVRNTDEAISLMQKGVGYSRKSQELSKAARIVSSLEKAGITEDKIPFVMELFQKRPEAVSQFFKQNDIDPLDVDITDDIQYTPNQRVIDNKEFEFNSALQEVSKQDSGKEFLVTINSNWDDSSKDVIFEDPSIIHELKGQYESGVYQLITTEMDRLKTLGVVPDRMPFLQAYKAVGDSLLEARGHSAKQAGSNTGDVATGTKLASKAAPLAVRPAMGGQGGSNAKLAQAGVRPASKPSALVKDFSSMSDEDFLKMQP